MDESSIKLSMKIPGYSDLVKSTIFYTVFLGGEEGVSIRDLRAAGQISTISWSSIAPLIVWVACWQTLVLEGGVEVVGR